MQKYSNPLSKIDDESKLGVNPCSIPLVIKTRKVSVGNQFYVDEDGDKLPVEVELEYATSFKVYDSAAHRKIVSNCSPAAKSLLLWIMYEIKSGKDYLWINKDRYMEETSTSYNTFKKALMQLHRYALIAPATIKDVYWINPEYFFKGNRVKKYPKNTIEVYASSGQVINAREEKKIYGYGVNYSNHE